MGARDLLEDLLGAGLSLRLDGGQLIVAPRDQLTEQLRAAIRANKAGLVALLLPAAHGPGPSENYCAPGPGHLASDDRRLCTECSHFSNRGLVCWHPRRLAIQAPRDLGPLATMPQRCAGFLEVSR